MRKCFILSLTLPIISLSPHCRATPHRAQSKPQVMNRAQALRIAKRAIQARGGGNTATYTLEREGTNWRVGWQRIVGYKNGQPQFVPGGHGVLTINKYGQITKYSQGR